jgi:hypothetical protein
MDAVALRATVMVDAEHILQPRRADSLGITQAIN